MYKQREIVRSFVVQKRHLFWCIPNTCQIVKAQSQLFTITFVFNRFWKQRESVHGMFARRVIRFDAYQSRFNMLTRSQVLTITFAFNRFWKQCDSVRRMSAGSVVRNLQDNKVIFTIATYRHVRNSHIVFEQVLEAA
jgi:hypothetical protein